MNSRLAFLWGLRKGGVGTLQRCSCSCSESGLSEPNPGRFVCRSGSDPRDQDRGVHGRGCPETGGDGRKGFVKICPIAEPSSSVWRFRVSVNNSHPGMTAPAVCSSTLFFSLVRERASFVRCVFSFTAVLSRFFLFRKA